MISTVKKFFKSQDGGVMMMAGFTVPLVALGVVASVETAHQVAKKAKLQDALDAAIISCATHFEDTREQGTTWEECTHLRLDKFTESVWPGAELTFEEWRVIEDDWVQADMSAYIPPLFKLLPTYGLSVSAQAKVRRRPRVEVSLVLDVSASMLKDSKYPNMRTGALSFINTLYDEAEPDAIINISVLPYGDTVRFPSSYSDWLDLDYQNLTLQEQTDPDLNPFFALQQDNPQICETGGQTGKGDRFQCVPMMEWNGCFVDESDTNIKSSNVPSIPSFLPEFNLMEDANLQEHKRISFCPPEEATALLLEEERETLVNMISGLDENWQVTPPRRAVVGWGTGSDVAMSWGWRLLDPGNRGKFDEEADLPASPHPQLTKHIVILSDGQPVGVARKNDPSRSNTARDNLDEICAKIRTENGSSNNTIHVWSIAYGADTKVADSMRNCTAGEGIYYNAGITDVSGVFAAIARNIIATRAWLTN